ncbi:MAG TPA: MFS transporter [Usitatibacter sp.]|jgi:MFS family permease|nr:MFS transporter [Usitatibacter sp.]
MGTELAPPIIRRVLLSKGLRAFGDGYVSLLLPAYLLELGHSPVDVGIIATVTLLGSGVITLGVGWHAHRFALRTLLLASAALMAATGLGFALVTSFWPLLLIALVGTLNPSNGDVSVFLPLEHSVLSHAASDRNRTAVFANYSLVGSLAAAVGALAAGLPALAAHDWAIAPLAAMQAMFAFYALLAVATAVVYKGLPAAPEAEARRAPAPLTRSKARVYTLAALFGVDAFAGGLIAQSMIALWLYQRHGLTPGEAGAIFFCTSILSAISFILAVRIAGRIGLVNTMVFTHLPANACLVAIPFVDHLGVVIALLLVRGLLSQMDVPTRSSYVMSIVLPEERPAAASITTVPRSLAAAVGPSIAGAMLAVSPFGWPLVAAGAIKIAYDLALLATFRRVKPPEEEAASACARA